MVAQNMIVPTLCLANFAIQNGTGLINNLFSCDCPIPFLDIDRWQSNCMLYAFSNLMIKGLEMACRLQSTENAQRKVPITIGTFQLCKTQHKLWDMNKSL